MVYTRTSIHDIPQIDKHGIHLGVYPRIGDSGVVLVETKEGHRQEFYHKTSTFNYIVLEGTGRFFLNDEEVPVQKGDMLSVEPNTRIYYKGAMKLVLITNPAWTEEGEVEVRAKIW